MRYQKAVIVAIVTLIFCLPTFGSDKPEFEPLPALIGGSITGGLFVSALVPSIVFTALYFDEYQNAEAMQYGMISSVSALAAVIAIPLIALEFIYFYSYVPLIIGLTCGVSTLAALIPAAIMTERYNNQGDHSREVVTAMSWLWPAFACTFIPTGIAIAIGVLRGVIRFNTKKEEQRVSLLLGADRVGFVVAL